MIVIMGTQMGKTAGLLNIVGQKLDDDPAPMLYIGPTKSNVDRVIEPELTKMLKSAPSLWMKTDKSRRAQKLAKNVAGVSVRLAWAGSPTELASQPAHTVFVDERDRMKPVPGEGDVMELADARTSNYRGGRIIGTSTPTEGNVDVEVNAKTGIEHWKVAETKDVVSPIWRLWQGGTRHEWAVPCPHCTEYFVPRLRNLWWPEKASPRVARREARLVCPRCGAQIEEISKTAMNAAGHFLAPGQNVVDGAVTGEPPESDTASFWVTGLMSPWRSFGERASAYVRALREGDQETLRVVINTGFGELYAFRGEAPPAAAVRACAGAYKFGQVPAAVRALTCGVDVQKMRLVYAVRGWSYSMESWLIESGEIHGETDQLQVWMDLGQLLERRWGESKDKPGLALIRMGIDSGYRPGDKWRRPENLIYQFCDRHRRSVPTKGHDRQNKPLQPALIDVTLRGQVYKRGLQLWHIDSDYFKSWVHDRLKWPEDQPGRFWVPSDVSEDYCLQLTSETRVPKPSGIATWIKIRSENHLLDCEAINVAMAQSLGFHRRARRRKAEAPATTGDAEPVQQPAPQPLPARRRSPMAFPPRNFTTEW